MKKFWHFSSVVVLYLASIHCECQKNLCPVQTNDGEFDFIFLLYSLSKFATGIWRWRIRCLMEVLLVGLRFVTLVIRRYSKSCWTPYKIDFKPNDCLCVSVSFSSCWCWWFHVYLCSPCYCILKQNQLLEHLLTLLPRCYLRENMMARYPHDCLKKLWDKSIWWLANWFLS